MMKKLNSAFLNVFLSAWFVWFVSISLGCQTRQQAVQMQQQQALLAAVMRCRTMPVVDNKRNARGTYTRRAA